MIIDYKLIDGSSNDYKHPIQTVMANRGIEDYTTYLNLNDSCVHDPHLLKNIDKAAECFISHLDAEDEITIVVDCDVDGYTSAATIYNYIFDYTDKCKVNYLLHTGKQHGLTDDILIPETTKLLIIPDAGSNDVEQCKKIKEKLGIDIIILDHHICDVENPYAIIVNNQMCDYPNKNFSGVGIVYKFLQVVDEVSWSYYADKYIDLVAVGNIADVMDMREYETKYLCMKGLNLVENPLVAAIIEKNKFFIEATPTIIDIQFNVVPLINALIRTGSMEQKDMMFRAMIGNKETFKYKKRGATEEIDESIAERVAREAGNLKAKQKKIEAEAISVIKENVAKFGLDKNKIIFCNVTGILDPNLTGVTAIKVAEMYNRPCLLLRRMKDENKKDVFGGSGRNIDGSPIESLKDFLSSTEEFESVTGHDNAFGIEIKKENINPAIEKCNDLLTGVDVKKYYLVDFDFDYRCLNLDFIRSLYSIHNTYGQGAKEPMIMLHNIPLSKSDCHIMGKTSNTWKWNDGERGFECVKFFCSQDEPVMEWLNESWDENDLMTIDAICKVGMNQFKGTVTPQIKVLAYEEVK